MVMVTKNIKFGPGIRVTHLVGRVIYRATDAEWFDTRLHLGLRNATSFKLQVNKQDYQDYKVTDLERKIGVNFKPGESISLKQAQKFRSETKWIADRLSRKQVEVVSIHFQANIRDKEGNEFAVNFGAASYDPTDPTSLNQAIEEFMANLDNYQTWVDEDKEEEYEVT